MSRIFKFLCLCLFAMCLTAGYAMAAAPWKLGHTMPKGTPEDKAIQDFTKRVEELTDGKIKIKVFPAMQLGDWTVMQQRVAMGGIEMATQPPSSQADKRISFVYFPYLFKNMDIMKKNLALGAPFRKELDELFINQNIYPVAYIPLFPGGIGAKVLPQQWEVPGAPKNVKLRVPNDPSFALHAEKMGYLPTPIPMSDTFTALQTGIVDGVLGFGAVGNYNNYRDLVKYYFPMNDFMQIWPVMINLDLWKKLPEEQKKAITQAAQELEDRCYADVMQRDADYKAKLKEAGVQVMDVTPAIIDVYAKNAKDTCWEELAEKIDKEWINKALGTIIE